MKFRITSKIYYASIIIIWLVYILYGFYYIDKIKSRPTVLYELLIVAGIIQMTLINFLQSWYYKGRPTLLDWFRFTTFYVVIINYLTMIDKLDQGIIQIYGTIYLKQELIVSSLLTIFIGLVALKIPEFIIMHTNKKYRREIKEKDLYLAYFIKYKYLFFGLGIAVFVSRFVLLLTGQIGYGSDEDASVSGLSFLIIIIGSLSNFYLLCLGFLKFYYNVKDKSVTLFLYIFLAISLVFGLFSGMKEYTLTPIVCFALPFLLGGRTLPKSIMITGGIVLILIYPINDNYRFILDNYREMKKSDAISLALAKTFSGDFGDLFSESSEKFSTRLSMFPILTYSLDIEPQWTEYKNMNRYIFLPVSFLPRFMVPQKPISNTGTILNKMITGYDNSSQTPTTYGWAYMEGGIIYVFLDFLILGLLISLIEYRPVRNMFFYYILYGHVLIIMLKVEADVYFLVAKIMQDFIIFYLLFRLFIGEKKLAKLPKE